MHPRFHTAFSALPATLQSALQPYLDAPDFPAMFTAEQAAAIRTGCGLDDDALAFALLPLAAACSLTPISHFHVGAIARGQSGNLYFGANMEFSGAPLQQTVHAEQCAVTHAWLRGEPALASVTVNYTPCGHCRQFMNELNSGGELQIRLPGRAPATLADYLPDAFGPKDLDIASLLMDEVDHGHRLTLDDDPAEHLRRRLPEHPPRRAGRTAGGDHQPMGRHPRHPGGAGLPKRQPRRVLSAQRRSHPVPPLTAPPAKYNAPTPPETLSLVKKSFDCR